MQTKSRKQGNKGGKVRMGSLGFGPGGQCVCPSCGTKSAHKAGFPCMETKCPRCGSSMTRTGR